MIDEIIKKRVDEIVKEIRCERCNRLFIEGNLEIAALKYICKCGYINYIIGKVGIEKKKNKIDF